MPLGETIGRAYIRILADGTGLEADVRRQFREHEPVFERAGQDSGRAYNQGFNDAFRNEQDPMDSLEEALRRGMGRWDGIGSLMGSEVMEGLADEINRRFPDLERRLDGDTRGIGDVIAQNLRESLARGDIGETELIARLHNIRREVAVASQEIAKEQSQAFDELANSVKRFAEATERGGLGRRGELRQQLLQLRDAMPDLIRHSEDFRIKWRDTNRELARATPKLDAFKNSLKGAGGNIGRFFGKGSRNDFLNFFGSFVGGIGTVVQALASFPKWFGIAAEGMQSLIGRFAALREETGSTIQALLQIGAQGLPGLVSFVATVGVLVSTLSALIPAFGAAIVLASGAVLALAGSLAFALAGALTAVAGALVPFAAAIGVVAVAVGGLDKKAGTFKKLKEDWKDLQKETSVALFGKKQEGLEAVRDILEAIKPLVLDVATAVGDVLKAFGKAAQTQGFKDLMTQISGVLTPMVPILGKIIGNVGTFLGRAFVAAGPMITEFLGWLEDLTGALANSGLSPKGGKKGDKSPLTVWMEGAWESAKKVGGFIKEILGLIGDLLGAGKDTGDNVFVKMTGWVKDLRLKLEEAKRNGTLEKFFKDAELLLDKLGKIVVDVGKLILALDTPTSRTILFKLLDVADWLIQKLTTIAGWIDIINQGNLANATDVQHGATNFFDSWDIKGAWTGFWNSFKPGDAVQGFIDSIDIKGAFTGFFDSIDISGAWHGFWASIDMTPVDTWLTGIGDQISQGFQGFWDSIDPGAAISGFFDSIDISGAVTGFIDSIKQPFIDLYNYLIGNSLIPDLVDGIVALFAGLPGRIIGALGNLGTAFGTWVATLPGKARAAVTTIIAAFGGLAGKIISRAGSMASSFAGWVASLAGKARSTAVSIASAFAGLAGKIISRAGSIASSFASWLATLPGKARAIAAQIVSAFSGLAGKAIKAMGELGSQLASWGRGAVSKAQGIARDIVSAFRGLASDIVDAIGTIIPKIKMPNIPRPVVDAIVKVKDKVTATGGVFNGAQYRLIGEAGPEAVVPLSRSLSQVDPAVRALSAFAQGLNTGGSTSTRAGRTIDIGGITINTPTENPRAVASEVIAHMAAAAYI